MKSLQLKSFTKRYGRAKTAAVMGVSLSVKPGEVYGFIGSNGAGKSTTIRTVMDFLRATEGSVKILGKDSAMNSAELKKSMGYLSGDVALPRDTTGKKLLDFLASLQGGVDREYLQQLIERFDAQLDKKIGTLSKGNKQKIGIIQAFMHQPKVLVLDEPTSGLDPLMQEQFYKTVHEAKARGAAIFLSSHSLNEVERMCDRVGIIRDGELVYEGPLDEILQKQTPVWRVALAKKSDVAKLRKASGVEIVEAEEASVMLEPTGKLKDAFAALATVDVVSIEIDEEQELEEEFMTFYAEGGQS